MSQTQVSAEPGVFLSGGMKDGHNATAGAADGVGAAPGFDASAKLARPHSGAGLAKAKVLGTAPPQLLVVMPLAVEPTNFGQPSTACTVTTPPPSAIAPACLAARQSEESLL